MLLAYGTHHKNCKRREAYGIESMGWSLLGMSRPYIVDLVKTHAIWMGEFTTMHLIL